MLVSPNSCLERVEKFYAPTLVNRIYENMGTTQRYLMFVSYVGSSFWGSQIQVLKEGSQTRETVQYVLENGLKYVYRLKGERPIRVNLASRTDRGVHALKAALHVDLPPYRQNFLRPQAIKASLNLYFKDLRNVRILEVYPVSDSFSVVSSVLDKTYLYRVAVLKKEFSNTYERHIIPITESERTYFLDGTKEFDLRKVEEATRLFIGKKDFLGVAGKPTKITRSTICNVMSFTVEEAQPLIPFDPLSQRFKYYHFICKGDRFLYHMVRRMVSLTLSVGSNILSLNDIQKLFDNPVPSSWPKKLNFSVDGCGLYLVDVNIDLTKIGLEKKTEEIPVVENCGTLL